MLIWFDWKSAIFYAFMMSPDCEWQAKKRQAVNLTEPIQYSWPIGFLVVWILLIIKAISLGLSMKLKNAVMREI